MDNMLTNYFSDLALDICNNLGETEVFAVQRVADVMGYDFTVQVFNKTIEIINTGGMLRRDGTYRTNGGIFFQAVKHYTNEEQRKLIFSEVNKFKKQRSKAHKALCANN